MLEMDNIPEDNIHEPKEPNLIQKIYIKPKPKLIKDLNGFEIWYKITRFKFDSNQNIQYLNIPEFIFSYF